MSTYLLSVINFMVKHHGDQKRKYSGVPYATHPLDVATLVSLVVDDEEVIAGTLIHDLFEDTKATEQEALEVCGAKAVRIARRLTNVPVEPGVSRERRKAQDLERLAGGNWEEQTVKIADAICNVPSVTDNDPIFAVKYRKDAQKLLDALQLADITLRARLQAILAN